ncbi:MAG: InlB B-repeat-containing protein [Ruminiclostridium sp.]|nr:InlB B-repeat-containing protein [Ruminiclostridium sp.]
MKNIKRRAASVILAAATVLSAGAASVGGGALGFLPSFVLSASAATGVTYINSSDEEKICDKYSKITSSTGNLNGGWYVVSGSVTINGRIDVTKDSYIILTNGSKLTVKGGIGVKSGVKFNVYTQDDATGSLYAGTTNGSNVTASSGYCGIGGSGAKVNIVGGNVYAKGSNGAYGITGSQIRLYWTNPSDSIYASSYSTSPTLYSAFANAENGVAYSSNTTVSTAALNNVTLKAANLIESYTTNLNGGTYVVSGSTNVPNRLNVYGNVTILLAKNATLRADEGITVDSGNTLTIAGENGRVFAGTSNGSTFTAMDNDAGIGSSRGARTGNIIIKSGTVYANGGRNAAGIGGNGSSVQITGGNVTANGGTYGAGIGSGYGDNGSDVTITGGNVTAKGGSNAAGIGSGYSSSNSSITLSYSSNNDSIYASSYSGNINFLKTMYTSDGQVAKSNNINGVKLSSKATTFTVSFESNGAGYISPKTVNAGQTLSVIPYVEKSGYVFDGWYLDRNFYNRFYDNMIIDSNITLYAKWIANGYTITYVTNGGTSVRSRQVRAGDPIGASELSYRDGYEFTGWYTDRNCRYLVNIDTPLYENITLYAGWRPISKYCTLYFRPNGGSDVDSYDVYSGTRVYQYEMPVPSRKGYSFKGWYLDQYCQNMSSYYTITSDTVFYAGWQPDAVYHTVKIDTNGGNYMDPIQVLDGDTIGYLRDPVRSGYTFVGWYLDRSGVREFYPYGTPITSDMTIYAGWNLDVTYVTVTFRVDGGLYDTQTVAAGSIIRDPGEPIDGYYHGDWDGWYDQYDNYFRFYEPVYSDTVLYARWVEREEPSWFGSNFGGAGLIAAIAGGVVLIGGGTAAGIAISKKKKKEQAGNNETNENSNEDK